ncbi:MAG: hypothetical protein B6D61_04460 [Bacteroidetes bacterium 4484_249]|nr:MAG: hypothetical protein B6D61_04460 [Bacteroidetes bacterium 4484_249]
MGQSAAIIAEYENEKYLFEAYYTFHFNKLYEEVKDKTNCTLKEKLSTLLILFTYVQENYISTSNGLRKSEEYKFKIDTIYEDNQQFRDDIYHWYSKCTTQYGIIEVLFKLLNDKVVEIYLYNNDGFGMYCPLSYKTKTKEDLVFWPSNVAPEVYGDEAEYYIVTNENGSTCCKLVFSPTWVGTCFQ